MVSQYEGREVRWNRGVSMASRVCHKTLVKKAYAAYHCATPNAVSSHFPSFVLKKNSDWIFSFFFEVSWIESISCYPLCRKASRLDSLWTTARIWPVTTTVVSSNSGECKTPVCFFFPKNLENFKEDSKEDSLQKEARWEETALGLKHNGRPYGPVSIFGTHSSPWKRPCFKPNAVPSPYCLSNQFSRIFWLFFFFRARELPAPVLPDIISGYFLRVFERLTCGKLTKEEACDILMYLLRFVPRRYRETMAFLSYVSSSFFKIKFFSKKNFSKNFSKKNFFFRNFFKKCFSKLKIFLFFFIVFL